MIHRLAVPLSLAGALLLAFAAGAASAERVDLAPRYAAGDAYMLSLSTVTDTRASSQDGAQRRTWEDRVRLDYEAAVRVLEVDAQGHPRRERHTGVRLTARRPDGERSLFDDGTAFEVRRDGEALRVLVNGSRIEPALEEIVRSVLQDRFEDAAADALLDPGRPVAVGETWELDPALARRFLRARGVRAVRLAGPATASLQLQPQGEPHGQRVVAYRIPVAWLEAEGLPENARTAGSEALYEGQIRLPAEAGDATRHASTLTLRLHGHLEGAGPAQTAPWSLERSKIADQSVRVVQRAEASEPGAREPEAPPVASLFVREPARAPRR